MVRPNPYESPGTVKLQPQRQLTLPALMALHMGAFAGGISCFKLTYPAGGQLVFSGFEFSTWRFLGTVLFGVFSGYIAGSLIKSAIFKWPSKFCLKIPERKRNRTLFAYLLVPFAIGLWHIYNLNWFGMLCLYGMGGGAALIAIECWRLGEQNAA